MPRHLLLLPFTLAACPGRQAVDPCAGADDPFIELGQGVGGAFAPLADGAQVGLVSAPQGGFGVSVLVRSEGLLAGEGALAEVLLDTRVAGETTGSFLLEDAPLYCNSDGSGGFLSGIVVGFDSSRYGSNDAFLALDGSAVDLAVTVTDEEGRVAEVVTTVTLIVGG